VPSFSRPVYWKLFVELAPLEDALPNGSYVYEVVTLPELSARATVEPSASERKLLVRATSRTRTRSEIGVVLPRTKDETASSTASFDVKSWETRP